MTQITIAGSINMDIVAQTTRHPKPGETVFGTDVHFIPGGKGANQAVAASRLGGNVRILGKIGEDAFGETLQRFLRSEQLNLDGVTSSEAPTGTALIVVDENSENTIVVIPGSNAKLSINDLDVVELAQSEIVVSQFEIPQQVIHALFKRARAAGAITILNPAPAAPCPRGLLALTDYLIVNETELAFYVDRELVEGDKDGVVSLARKVRVNSDQVVIVTLGAKGAICIYGDELIEISSHKVKAIDTTGAGDCFVGALAVAISEEKSLKSALEFANAAAAISVQRLGASASLPTRAEVDVFLAKKTNADH